MLAEKPWRVDAILRLILSVFVCFFAGSFLLAALQHVNAAPLVHAKVYGLVIASLLCLGAALWLLSKHWVFGEGVKRAAILMGLFYLGLVLGGCAARIAGPTKPSIVQMIVSALSLQGALLVLLGGFLREHQTSWSEAFGFKSRWPLALFAGIVLACVFTPIAWKLQEFSAWLMTRLHVQPQLQQVVQTLESDRAAHARLVFGAITLLIVPVAEEAFFRGILYTWVKAIGYPRLALWGSSILFAAVHANLAGFLPFTLLALLLVALYERTGNLLAPVAAHTLFNAANLARFYLLEHTLRT